MYGDIYVAGSRGLDFLPFSLRWSSTQVGPLPFTKDRAKGLKVNGLRVQGKPIYRCAYMCMYGDIYVAGSRGWGSRPFSRRWSSTQVRDTPIQGYNPPSPFTPPPTPPFSPPVQTFHSHCHSSLHTSSAHLPFRLSHSHLPFHTLPFTPSHSHLPFTPPIL